MTTIYKVQTDKSIFDAKNDLVNNLKTIGFGVLFELNFKDKVEEKGFKLANNFIMIDVCNPSTASEILTQNIEMGYILPCKVVIYENNDKRYVGLLKPTIMVDLISPEYRKIAQEIEEKMIKAINLSA